MKIFSVVQATIDGMITPFLPSDEDLKTLLEKVTGFDVDVFRQNNQICLSGSWQTLIASEALILNLVQEREENYSFEKDLVCDNVVNCTETVTANDKSDQAFTEMSPVKVSSESENEDCLNIEVFHSESNKESSIKDFKFSCSLCSFKSQRESHFVKHTALHGTMAQIHRCEECSFSTLRLTHLRRHQVVHSVKTFTCSSCDYSTDDAKLLSRHIRMKHKKVHLPSSDEANQPLQQCPSCSYTTTRLYLYERHMKVHSAEESKGGPNLFICSQCDYRTSRKIHYVRHVRDVHRQWRPYLCHNCGKAFKRPDALKQHSLLHSTPDTEAKLAAFQCRLCDKICHSRAHLKEHQAVHSSERSFLCEICGASFKTRSVQRKHVATLHQNPRAFSCQICNKRFNTNYALRRHMKQHPANQEIDEEDHNVPSKIVTIVLPTDQSNHSDEGLTLTVKIDNEETLLYLPQENNSPSLPA